jgi:hypothetical protein
MEMTLSRLLLACGVLAAPLFIATDIVAASVLYPGYDYSAQQVSELSAIGAPSRDFWMIMGYPYDLLTVAFAIGVWIVAAGRLNLRLAAVFILLFAANSFAWGWVAPMHMRGTQFTDSDTLHIAFAVSAVVLMIGFIGSGATALGRDFRIYSAVTLALIMVAGAVVSTQIPAIAANQPTPWMGLVERISVYGPLVWIAVFGMMLLRVADGARQVSAA